MPLLHQLAPLVAHCNIVVLSKAGLKVDLLGHYCIRISVSVWKHPNNGIRSSPLWVGSIIRYISQALTIRICRLTIPGLTRRVSQWSPAICLVADSILRNSYQLPCAPSTEAMSSDEHSFSDSGVDVCSDDLQYKQDSPLLEYGLSKHRRDGLTLSAYSSRLWTYSMLFISLVFCCCSLVLLAAAFIPGDLDTRCESKMTGWCE